MARTTRTTGPGKSASARDMTKRLLKSGVTEQPAGRHRGAAVTPTAVAAAKPPRLRKPRKIVAGL